MLKDKIIAKIIELEGGYVNNPNDSGGETNFGITVNTAREAGYLGDMKDLPRELAECIYESKYWDSVSASDIAVQSEAIAEEVVDTGVNMGPVRAAKFLQRTLNILNKQRTLYPDINVDGVIGRNTLRALASYLEVREEKVLVKILNCFQGACYIRLAETREKDEDFLYGWFRNRVVL
jgi:lysozyme family protein